MRRSGAHEYQLYELVEERRRELTMQPRLASWDASTSPSQQALQRYLEHVEDLLAQDTPTARPEALELHVGITDEAVMADRGHDLDNYLFPVAIRLGSRSLRVVRGLKRPGGEPSVLRWGRAVTSEAVVDGSWRFVEATSSTSVERPGWKVEIHDQIAEGRTPPETLRAVEMEIAFRVGPSRNWANLWKPAIDCLGPIVGAGEHRFAPRDDLITRLGLHQTVDEDLGYRVEIGVWWRPAAKTA